MGYNQNTSIAIRATSDYYDRCSERDEREASFFYEGELYGTSHNWCADRARHKDTDLRIWWHCSSPQNADCPNPTHPGCKSQICTSGC